MRGVRLGTALVIALAALLVFPFGSSGRAVADNTWAGTWNTDFGKMTLGAGGSGTYAGFSPGSLSGTITKNVLKGTWTQPGDPPKTGTFTFTMSSDGRSFSGVWAYESGGCGTACGWSGTCVAGACLKNGTNPTQPAEVKGCPVPPRLPAGLGKAPCNYKVALRFEQHRPAVRGDLSETTTIGSGRFYITMTGQRPAGGCATYRDVAVKARHVHEQIALDDLVLDFQTNDLEETCLTVKRQGKKVVALVVTAAVEVERSNDRDCPVGKRGELVLRAGEPFPYVIIDLCGHREVYSPPKSKDPERTVRVAIKVRSL